MSDPQQVNVPYDLLDHCSDLIQSVSPEGNFIYVNRAWLDTLGYAPGEIPGLKMLDVIHPGWRSHCMDIFQRLMSGEDVGLVEVVFVTGADLGVGVPIGRTRWEMDTFGVSPKDWDTHRQALRAHEPFRDFEFGRLGLDGSPRWFSVSGEPSFDNDGRFIGYFGVGRDITRRKQAEGDLAVARERLGLALSGSKLAVWDWDERAGKVYLSKEWNAMLGNPAQASELLIADLITSAHPEDHERIGIARRGVLKGPGLDYRVEHRVRMADGGWKWILSYGTVTKRASDGRILRITGINADIDDLKQVEAALRKAKEAADFANRAKSEFVSRMSHELRTPLNAILGFSELLAAGASGPLTADQEQCAEQILHSGRHLLNLIDDLLDLSKIESDRIEVSLEPVQVEDILLEVLAMSETMAQQRAIVLRMEERALSAPLVLADPTRLRQVLLN